MPMARPAATASTTVAIVPRVATTIERLGTGAASTMASGLRCATDDMPLEPTNAARPMRTRGPRIDITSAFIQPAGLPIPDPTNPSKPDGSSFSKSASTSSRAG